MGSVAAVDLGATSGRVMLARLEDDAPALTELARFPNEPHLRGESWVWDIDSLHRSMVEGLASAVELGAASFGIDTWAVDYGVVRRSDGAQVGPVRAYRDPRHGAGVARVEAAMPWSRLYGITGTQFMPINTIYQIAADEPQRLVEGTTMLMVPDLLSWRLTGQAGTDVTNASSTGMVDPRTRRWSPEVLAALGLPTSAFLDPTEPGSARGEALDPRLSGLPLVGVATHDTASAFAGAPITDRDRALVLSLGTWALVGVETGDATPTDAARDLNLTHELGVERTVRLLRNVCGMWLLEECRRDWARVDGRETTVPDLLDAALAAPAFAAVVDVDDPTLAMPGQCARTIQARLVGRWDGSRGAVVRVLLESMVARIAQRVEEIQSLTATHRDALHVVGGASRLAPVMQWLADATGRRVIAGPVEATALGNAAVQWCASGAVSGIAEARSRIGLMPEIRRYEPTGDARAWQDLADRLEERT